MKYTVKYRKQKHDAFANVGEIRKATRGKFAGTSVFRDIIFDTYEEAESVRKEYALKYGNKPAARKYFTYPSTIRNWVKRYNEFGLEGLKIKK